MIGDWVIASVCRQARACDRDRGRDVAAAINIPTCHQPELFEVGSQMDSTPVGHTQHVKDAAPPRVWMIVVLFDVIDSERRRHREDAGYSPSTLI
jgi:hypothetical protein